MRGNDPNGQLIICPLEIVNRIEQSAHSRTNDHHIHSLHVAGPQSRMSNSICSQSHFIIDLQIHADSG